jgi:hypothetical protein
VLSPKGTAWALERRAARYFPEGVPEVVRDERLNLPVWRHVLDSRFYPAADEMIETVSRREAPSYVEIYQLVEAYVSAVKKFMQVGSLRAYEASWLQTDPRDLCPIALLPEDEEEALRWKLLHPREGLQAVITRKLKIALAAFEEQEPEADGEWSPIK